MPASRPIQSRPELSEKSRAVQEMASCGRLIKASLNKVRVTCGKPSCRCAENRRFRHAALTFTYKVDGRSVCLHVPRNMEKEARQAAADYLRLKKLVQKLSNSNLKKFRREIEVMKAKTRARRKLHA